MKLTWFPPATVTGLDSVEFGESKPYLLRDIQGFASLPNQPQSARAPFQPGATLLDNVVGGKSLQLQITIKVDTREEYWTRRAELAHAFSVVPRFDQRVPETGTLRLEREGQDTVDLECVPVESPAFGGRGRTLVHALIELFAPSPWWRAPTDISEFFQNEGGIEIIEEGNTDEGLAIAEAGSSDEGLAIPFDQALSELDNDGHAPVPLIVTISGEVDTPRLELEETGDTLQIDGVIAADEQIRINTDFGKKEVTLIDSAGAESNAFNRLNTDHADFFWLRRGANSLRFSFVNNPSGSATLTWRKRFAGV